MIAEPFICKATGEITWIPLCPSGEPHYKDDLGGGWQPYADFEREKLKELGGKSIITGFREGCFVLSVGGGRIRYFYDSQEERYSLEQYQADSESNRLLKRMEFLREVCKREGVVWPPEYCDTCGKSL